jgi:hypothetical protein
MKTIPKKVFLLAASVCAAVLGCTMSKVAEPVGPMAGGASGTEISACVVSGAIIDSANNPIAGCMVRLRPYNYISGVDSLVPGAMQDGSTNLAGKFMLDSVPPGQYVIEIIYGDSMGQSIEFAVNSSESLHVLPPERMMSLPTVFGYNVPLVPHGTGADQPSANAIGFERSVPIDSMGHFEMKVPPGWCRLHLEGIDTSRYHGDTIIYLTPGKRYNVMPPPLFFFPCDSLSCEMRWVQEILDSNGIAALTPESVTVVESGHVTQLLLRGRGLRVLPGSACLLWRLRVLDIGKNFIRELPMGISNLARLTTLRADSNALWIVPATIGMLYGLRELDLSNNWLSSLPRPITSLMPTKLLKLDGNMLCNLGDFTAGWADRYSFGWRERQFCW